MCAGGGGGGEEQTGVCLAFLCATGGLCYYAYVCGWMEVRLLTKYCCDAAIEVDFANGIF
jgi:hypothetical protein